jgi:hypothetical protein
LEIVRRIKKHQTFGRCQEGLHHYAHGASFASGAARGNGIAPALVLFTLREGKDRRDCMRQFRAAWDRFAADEGNLTEFLNAKRLGHFA